MSSILAEALRLFNDEIEKAFDDEAIMKDFNSKQPRAPKGTPIGGQWVSEGGDGPAGHKYALAKGIALQAATKTKNADMKKWVENKVAQVQAALEQNDKAALDKLKDGGVGKVKELIASAKEAMDSKKTALATGAVVGATGAALKPNEAWLKVADNFIQNSPANLGSQEFQTDLKNVMNAYLKGDIATLNDMANNELNLALGTEPGIDLALAAHADLQTKANASAVAAAQAAAKAPLSTVGKPTKDSMNAIYTSTAFQVGSNGLMTPSNSAYKEAQNSYLAGDVAALEQQAKDLTLPKNKQFVQNLADNLKNQQGGVPVASTGPTEDKFLAAHAAAAAAHGKSKSAGGTNKMGVAGMGLTVSNDLKTAYMAGDVQALQQLEAKYNQTGNKAFAQNLINDLQGKQGATATPAVPPTVAMPAGAFADLNKEGGAFTASQSLQTYGSGLASIKNPINISSLVPDGPQQGSNPGGWYKDPTSGERFYIKTPKTDDHVKVEVLSAHLAGLTGVEGPQVRAGINADGKMVVVSRAVDGATSFKGASDPDLLRANRDFAFHAATANWDAIGQTYDNQLRLANGQPATVDFGGSLIYRAQGGTKPFMNDPTELQSMRDPSKNSQAAKIFGDNSPEAAQMRRESAQRLAGLTEVAIVQSVQASGLPPTVAAQIQNSLIARRTAILQAASFNSLKNGITPANSAFYTPSELAAAVPKMAAVQSKTAGLASATSAAAKAAASGPAPPSVGETISYFQFVQAGPSASPFRQALAAAPRLKEDDLPGFAALGTTPAEVKAIKSYQNGSSQHHSELRVNAGVSVSQSIRTEGNALSAVIARSVVTAPAHIVRSVEISPSAWERISRGTGMEFIDPGFMGGSAEGGSYGGHQYLRINLPPGAQAAALRRAGNTGKFSSEGEVLIQRNSRYRIVRAETVNGKRVFEVDWIGVQPTNL